MRHWLGASVVGVLVGLSSVVAAEPGIRPDPMASIGDGKRAKQYEGKIFESAEGDELPFVMLAPTKSGKHPIALFFHGGGGRRGNGFQIQSYVRDLGSKSNLERVPCVLLAPHSSLGWGDGAASAEGDRVRGLVKSLVERVAAEGSVDPKRLLVIGEGDGAQAALAFAAANPGAVRGVVASGLEGPISPEVEAGLGGVSVALVHHEEAVPASLQQTHDRLRAKSKGGKVTLIRAEAGEKGRAGVIDWLFRL